MACVSETVAVLSLELQSPLCAQLWPFTDFLLTIEDAKHNAISGLTKETIFLV